MRGLEPTRLRLGGVPDLDTIVLDDMGDPTEDAAALLARPSRLALVALIRDPVH